jgi:hypothetical protein
MLRALLVALFAAQAGCGLVNIQGVTDPSKDAEPAASSTSAPTASGPTASDASGTAPVVEKRSRGDEDAQRNLLGWAQHAGEHERMGTLSVSYATEGVSAADFDARIKPYYKDGGTPSKETLAARDELVARFAKLVSVEGKGDPPKRAPADAKAEKSMRESFERYHKDATIKAVYLTDSAWKQNYTDELKTKVRNRYKDGVVIIAVKDQAVCVAVPANVAQASTGNGFAPEYKHDVFDAGRLVRCP